MKLYSGSDRVVARIPEESSKEEDALEETGIELLGEEENLVHVRLTGRLDTTGTAQVDTKFAAMISPRGKHALVDISEVSFLVSMGIRMMVSVARTLARRQKKIVLYGPPFETGQRRSLGYHQHERQFQDHVWGSLRGN